MKRAPDRDNQRHSHSFWIVWLILSMNWDGYGNYRHALQSTPHT